MDLSSTGSICSRRIQRGCWLSPSTHREAANRFVATGLVQQFRDRVLACTMQVPTDVDGYDLFYSASRSGDNVIFGEDAN